MTLLERAQQMVNGAVILRDWLGSGGHTVEHNLAQKRADTCLKCPMNSSTFSLVEAAAAAIKQQVEMKNHLQLRVNGEKGLHICQACGCAMRLKVWLPIERIMPEPSEREKFHELCWLRSEVPDVPLPL